MLFSFAGRAGNLPIYNKGRQERNFFRRGSAENRQLSGGKRRFASPFLQANEKSRYFAQKNCEKNEKTSLQFPNFVV